MTRTLLTIKEQKEWVAKNNTSLTHKWSTRGYGNSKIIHGWNDTIIGKAGGCGYDRYGAALGNAIMTLFPKEVHKLAKRECKGRRRNYKKSAKFYGLFFDSIEQRAWLDGGCGESCMRKILNKIGFALDYVGQSERTYNGEVFYTIRRVTKYEKQWI